MIFISMSIYFYMYMNLIIYEETRENTFLKLYKIVNAVHIK